MFENLLNLTVCVCVGGVRKCGLDRRIRYIGQLSCATGCSFHSPGLGHTLSGLAAILIMHVAVSRLPAQTFTIDRGKPVLNQ